MDAKELAARAGVVTVPKTRQQTLPLFFDLPFFFFIKTGFSNVGYRSLDQTACYQQSQSRRAPFIV
jgi:hypothetical protein